jgi:hypothetical protein
VIPAHSFGFPAHVIVINLLRSSEPTHKSPLRSAFHGKIRPCTFKVGSFVKNQDVTVPMLNFMLPCKYSSPPCRIHNLTQNPIGRVPSNDEFHPFSEIPFSLAPGNRRPAREPAPCAESEALLTFVCAPLRSRPCRGALLRVRVLSVCLLQAPVT